MKEALKKIDKTSLISIVTFAGFVISVMYHYSMSGWGYPYSTFLFRPWNRFNDYFMTINNGNSPYITGRPGSMFPLGHRIITVFNLVSPKVGLTVFLIGCACAFLWITYKNVPIEDKATKYVNVFVLGLLSYPLLFVLDRGNFEALLFLFLYGFIRWYNRNVKLSILCLVVAIGMKVFPAIFLLLLLSDKKYKEAAAAVALVIGLSFVSLLTFNGGLMEKVYWLLALLKNYNEIYLYRFEGTFFGHSLWGVIATIMFGAGHSAVELAANWYLVFVCVFFAGISYYIVFIEKEYWKRVALLVFAMNLLPYISGDYKLLHIFLPMFLFMNTGVPKRLDKLYAILFGLLLIPKAYYHFPFTSTFVNFGFEANSAIILNPLLMLTFTIIIVVQGVRNKYHENF